MRKRIWSASPVFFILSGVMLLMACASLQYSRPLALAEFGVCAVSVAATTISVRRFKNYVALSVKTAKRVLTAEESESLETFTMPVALVGAAGDIIWVNQAFLKRVSSQHEVRGENVQRIIYPKTLDQIIAASGTDITVDSRQYSVFGAHAKGGTILYFIDDTYYKEINREYTESRSVVCLAFFDNREELARDVSSSEDSRVASEVEDALCEWAQQMGGFSKRLSGGRYLIMTDEHHVRTAMEHRFQILDKVREVKTADNRSATLSIGIARGAGSLQEGEQWARKALDMALGRGGDQVALKQKDETYEFFGGLSKGVEKHDKVRTRVIAATLSDHIRQSDCVLIMGHKFGDLDCIGAAVGVWSAAANALHRPARVVVNRDQCMAKALIDHMESAGEQIFISPQEALPELTSHSLLVVVDTHNPDVVESPELLAAAQRVVVIDHHRMMVKHIENALVFYHEPYASSASELVAELVQYIGDTALSRTDAEALLAGIMLDTKNFVLKTGVRTFEAAAYLKRRGADTVEVKRLFSDNIETYKAKYRIVSSAQIQDDCAITYVEKEFPDIRLSCAQAADELLSIQGVAASFVIFPSGGMVNISARSLGDMNVQLVMEKMGGGGHLSMAGAQLAGVTVEQAKDQLFSLLASGVGRPPKQTGSSK
ncbi:MAG: DHH family phosphoesterase [Oscillospiraceae bacterium]|nr:DHH family phosphoesterase [Oscillospiraceae bacterium]